MCAIRDSGSIACWGRNNMGQISAPSGTFLDISAGGDAVAISCGITSSGSIDCWAGPSSLLNNIPVGTNYVDIECGRSNHCCAIQDTGTMECWGDNNSGETDIPTF